MRLVGWSTECANRMGGMLANVALRIEETIYCDEELEANEKRLVGWTM
jgi:hypothetical protein